MKNIYIVLYLLTAFHFSALAQEAEIKNHDFGLAFSVGPNETSEAISWKRVFPMSKNGKFKLGYGARFNAYQASDKNYITAPAHLTSGAKGPQVIFVENLEENIDTVAVNNALHNSLNAVIYIEYDFNDKFGLGFNIDAFGFSFGPSKVVQSISSTQTGGTSGSPIFNIMASPTPINVLLISDNDWGMLNSELYATYNFTKQLSVNAGFTFMFTEYRTENDIEYLIGGEPVVNDRFRNKSLMGMLSLNYKPFKH